MPARTGRGFPSHIPRFATAHIAYAAGATNFLTASGIFIQRSIDSTHFTGTVTCYLECNMFSDTGLSMTARLRNVTTNSVIGLSSVSTTSTTFARVISGPFSLDAGNNVYEVDIGGTTGGLFTLKDAVLLLVLS